MCPKMQERSALSTGLSMVARRRLTQHELAAKLARKGFQPPDIDEAIERLVGYGYVDDAGIVSSVQTKAKEQHRGPNWVRAALLKRGVTQALCDEAADDFEQHASKLAMLALEKRFAHVQDLSSVAPHGKQKAYQFLLRRGFAFECAANAMQVFFDDSKR